MKMMDLCYSVYSDVKYKNMLMTRIMNVIGDYLEDEISLACTESPTGYHIANIPYTGKIKKAVEDYAKTLDNADKDAPLVSGERAIILALLNDSNSGLRRFIDLMESEFTLIQTEALAQFNAPQTPPNPLPVVGCPPPYLYITGRVGSKILAIFNDPVFAISTVDSWLSFNYTRYGS
jgi:hypothetical protein